MDPQWVSQLREGSTDAFARIMEATRGAVYGVAYRITGRAAEAEEILQEAFLRLWKHRRDVSQALAWLRRVATNLSLDVVRRRKREAALPPRETSNPGPEIPEDRIQEAIARLDPERREVYCLRVMSGLSYREIAERLGVSLGTVMSRLHRARRDLYDGLKDELL